jgi:hypothetical protein
MVTEEEFFADDIPDSMQLGGILGTPDEPELYVLPETFRDTCTEGLNQHEECNSYSRDMPMAEAEIDKGIGSTGGVDIAVGHIINEQEGARPVQVDRSFIVHSHEEINIPFSQSTGVCTPCLVNTLIAVPALILLSVVFYLM